MYRLKDSNAKLFGISIMLGIAGVIFGNVCLTIFCSAMMICCFVDKSGYE